MLCLGGRELIIFDSVQDPDPHLPPAPEAKWTGGGRCRFKGTGDDV